MNLLLVTFLLAPQDQLEIHVSPAGRDENPGTEQAPVAGPSRARDLARASAGRKAVTITLAPGTYFLKEPLVLEAGDSGSPEAPVVWRAREPLKSVLSAGLPVGGWSVEDFNGRKVWVAAVPGAPRQLWVNGLRADRSRLPKEGFYRVESLPDLKGGTPWHEGQKRFTFKDGDLKASWKNPKDIELVAVHFWIDSRMPVDAINEAEHLVTLQKRSTFRLTDDHTQKGARYWVENVLEAVERPGEWAHDRVAGKLYYLPRPGEEPATASAIVPQHLHVLKLQGDPAKGAFVHHVTFQGLVFSHSEAHCPPQGTWPAADVAGPVQAAFTAPAAVHAVGARDCRFEDGAIAHVGGYGLELSRGCQGNRVTRLEIHDLGAGGIKIGEAGNPKEEALQTKRNEISDNRIHHGGLVFPAGIGVWVGHSAENLLAHNHVHHFYYSGFSIGWSWGYGSSGAHHNTIEYNLVHDIGQGMLSDMGGIYTLGISTGTVIRNNVFRDVVSHGYGGWGIYFDEGTSGVLAENNISIRCKSNGFHQHYGRENVLRNNLFALNRESQIARSRKEDHLTLTFERNIIYWTEGSLLSGNWDGDQFRFEKNLYWNPKSPKGTPEAWKAKGLDKDSVVADPLFEDVEKDDFRLKPDSPALKLGFQPIDVSKVGPRSRPAR